MSTQKELKIINALKTKRATFRPLSAQQAKELDQRVRIEHVWSSNAIEGNTLTRYETASILNTGMTVHGVPVKDVLETLDLNEAYEYMMTLASQKTPLSSTLIRTLNRIVTLQTTTDKANAGVYRILAAWPYGSEDKPYVAPFDIAPQMDDLITWSQAVQNDRHPVQYAADLHQKFVAIHPFADGNGRTARLLMNMALTQAGYPVINVQPNKEARNAYMEALAESRESGNLEPFEALIITYVRETLNQRISILQLNEKNQDDAKNDVDEHFEKFLKTRKQP
ncbi:MULTISPECIES: Fic family protein [Lactobacillaceae]|uniref:Fic family protein n=1 Tax=Lactobacillaceae TaxID=33958 RepID=UPI0014572513|nr:Fic family protein [Lactobacillus sp. HBUAS51381]NLR10650.1 Fic family protein [Lactobacillus sp. HBUAS51381]